MNTTPEQIEGLTVYQAETQLEEGQKKKTLEEQVLETVGDYSEITLTETEYLFFPWFIRGKLNAVQGDSESGKSTLLYCVGAHVSNGMPIGDVECEAPGKVMFLTMEDDESDILTAFLDAGGNDGNLRRIKNREIIARMTLNNQDVTNYLKQVIISLDLKFLVLDPIQAFLTGDINTASNTRPQMARLARIAEETKCCIAFIQHTGKDSSRKALHRGLGSTDIVAASRSLIQVVDDPEDENYRIAYTVKNNTADRKETCRAIRYQIKDHPGSTNPETGKRCHFHGHAEIVNIIPKYNERIHSAKLARIDSERSNQDKLQEYDSEPLVLTIRDLMKQNPNGLFIRYSDLRKAITDYYGYCPYGQGKGKDSLKGNIDSFRSLLIKQDKIQADNTLNGLTPKPYIWNGKQMVFEDPRSERGVHLRRVK